MLYQIKIAQTDRVVGSFEGDSPEEAIAVWLLSRGISSDVTLTIANALEGVIAIPDDPYWDLGYAEGLVFRSREAAADAP